MLVVPVVVPPTREYAAEKHLDLMSILVHLLRAEDDGEDDDGDDDDPPDATHRNANLVHPYVVIVIVIVIVIFSFENRDSKRNQCGW